MMSKWSSKHVEAIDRNKQQKKVHLVCPNVLIYSGTSVHERPCSRTIRFTNKFSEQNTSRMTNGVSDYEHASWQQRQPENIGAEVSVAG
jgi:hypothetical protein